MRTALLVLLAALATASCILIEPLARHALATPTRPPATSTAAAPTVATVGRTTPTAAAATATQPPSPSATPSGIVLVQDPASLTALVTKRRQLPASYVPEGLALVNGAVRSIGEQRIRSVALDPLRRMVAEMNAAGLAPAVVSSYRSYATQEQTYAYWVRTLGQAQADRVSARPGHSEHQLGLAVDFGSPSTGYELEQTFAGTPEGRWLAANARRFGFIMSYPQGKEALTGYDFEPWHFRYVGAEAQAIADRGLTLEEYLAGR